MRIAANAVPSLQRHVQHVRDDPAPDAVGGLLEKGESLAPAFQDGRDQPATRREFAGAIASRVYSEPLLRGTRTIRVYSAVTHKRYTIRLVRGDNHVTGTGINGIWVRFYYDGH